MICVWCDHEFRRPLRLAFRGNRRKVLCCPNCRGVLP